MIELLLAFLLAAPLKAETAPVVELYGSARIGQDEVEKALGPLVRRYLQERVSSARKSAERASELHDRIEAEARARWGLAWARLEPVRSLPEGGEHLALEVVEKADMNARMPFIPAPHGAEADPAGLLAAWETYSETGWERVRKGEAKVDRMDCPAYFCTWGSATPELAALEKRFVLEVPAQRDKLLKVLRQEADGGKRAAALYLLAYSKNGAEVCALSGEALLDPDESVREAGMRILSDVALHYPDLRLPMDRVLAALDYPYSEDRTRALAVLLALAENKEYRTMLLERAVPRVLRLLRLKHSGNHSMAHTVLGMLSKKTIGDRDYDAWEAWYKSASAKP